MSVNGDLWFPQQNFRTGDFFRCILQFHFDMCEMPQKKILNSKWNYLRYWSPSDVGWKQIWKMCFQALSVTSAKKVLVCSAGGTWEQLWVSISPPFM